ncbi:MAG: HEAT repeat domain-containing protein [Planctomycetota bacterium]
MPVGKAAAYACKPCKVRYTIPDAQPGRTYHCKKCKGPLFALPPSAQAPPPSPRDAAAAPTAIRGARPNLPASPRTEGVLRLEGKPADMPREIPVHISSYLIDAEIARGGMGVVYKARQKELNRVVAVKMMLGGAMASPEFIKRFHREAKAAARLQHPNIVAVYETGEYQGQPFIAMEYVDGSSLDRETERRPMEPRRAAEMMREVAEAMHLAHREGIIHRDLKPANILLTKEGLAKITDFGLAKEMGQSILSVTGEIVGTPAYMSPEQARGEVHQVDARSDVYALGGILYACLTGKPPFGGNSVVDMLAKVACEDPTPPEKLVAGLDPDLGAICLKAMEKHPDQRYQTAAALASDLEHWLNGEPVTAKPMSRGRALRRKLAKHRLTVQVAGALGALLIIVLIAAPFVFGKSYLDGVKGNLESASPEVRRTAYQTLAADFAGRAWESPEERTEALRLFLPGAVDADEAVSKTVLDYLKVHPDDAEARTQAQALLVGPLTERLKTSSNEGDRVAAIDVLGGLQAHDAVPALIPLVGDANEKVRLHAVRALGDIADRRALEPLLRAQIQDSVVRADARMALQKLYANSTIAPFSPNEGALKGALADMGEDMANLQRQYEELDADMGQGGPKAPIDVAMAALKDPDVATRLKAAYEIGTSLQDSKAVPALLTALGDADRDVGRAAAEALVQLRTEGLAAEATSRLKDPAPEMRRGAADLCGRLADRSLSDTLVLALGGESDASVRTALCDALAKSGEKAACSSLVEALREEDAAVRQAAASALAALTGQSFGTDREKWSAWLAGH